MVRYGFVMRIISRGGAGGGAMQPVWSDRSNKSALILHTARNLLKREQAYCLSQASSDVVHAHACTYMYLNDVDAGVAIVRADPLVDENTIVILSQRCDQFQPIKIVLTPRGVDNRPAADRRQKSPQGGITPLLNCFWNEQCPRGVHSLTAVTEQNTLQVHQAEDALVHKIT